MITKCLRSCLIHYSLQSIIKHKAEVRRQRKEIVAQREQRPPDQSPKHVASTVKPEPRKTSGPGRAAKTEASNTNDAELASQAAAAATANHAADSPQGASKVRVAFGRTTKLPPSQPQRQTKSAPFHRARAGSAENLNVRINWMI